MLVGVLSQKLNRTSIMSSFSSHASFGPVICTFFRGRFWGADISHGITVTEIYKTGMIICNDVDKNV